MTSHVEIPRFPIDRTRDLGIQTSFGDAEMDNYVVQHHDLPYTDAEARAGEDARVRRLAATLGMECRCVEDEVDVSSPLKLRSEQCRVEPRKVRILKVEELCPRQVSYEVIQSQGQITRKLIA